MQPIRKVIHDAPEILSIPAEFHHRSIELIIWPLEQDTTTLEPGEPAFMVADVQQIILPSREERNERI
jgi:hypothetical protein